MISLALLLSHAAAFFFGFGLAALFARLSIRRARRKLVLDLSKLRTPNDGWLVHPSAPWPR